MTAAIPAPGAFNQNASGGQPVHSLPNAQYGQQEAYRSQQQAAPLADSSQSSIAPSPSPSAVAGAAPPGGAPQPQMGPAGLPMGPTPLQPLPDLGAPTQRPNEPVTSGSPRGAGPNSLTGVPGQQQPTTSLKDALAPFFAADTTGVLANLANTLSQRGMW